MAASLKFNAYHVLGLDGSADNKLILQRSNEIIQRLKIDDVARYIFDIPSVRDFRNAESVRDAVRRLQVPRSQLIEYLFWFRVADEVDKQAARSFIQRDYQSAAKAWKDNANGNPAAFRYKRNFALACSIALLVTGDRRYLDESLSAWKEIFDSEKFWSVFFQSYAKDGEHHLNDDVTREFRESVPNYLSDIYAEIQDVSGKSEYVSEFRKLFAAKGERIEKDILNPTYQAIQGAIESLEKVDVGEKGRFDQSKGSRIKRAIGIIQTELNKLIQVGLYNDSSTKVVRDRAAAALRSIVLDLHNHQNEFKTADKLVEMAAEIAGTDSFRSQLSEELAQIQKSINSDEKDTLTLEVSGLIGEDAIVFKRDHLSYGNKKIFYKDATEIAYHASNYSINLIPVSQSYSYLVASKGEKIAVSFGTTLYIGNKKKQDVWQRLVGISQHMIEPHIVERLVNRIFAQGEDVKIGGLTFNQQGYSRDKLFGGQEAVAWVESYVPTFSSGQVVLWKGKDGKTSTFTSMPMSTPNAVVLPELIKACASYVQSHAKRTR